MENRSWPWPCLEHSDPEAHLLPLTIFTSASCIITVTSARTWAVLQACSQSHFKVSPPQGRHKIPCERTVSETWYACRHLTGYNSGSSLWFSLESLQARHRQRVSPSRRSLSAAVLQRYKDPFFPLRSLPTSFPAFIYQTTLALHLTIFTNLSIMRFLSLYIVFVSFSLTLLLSGGVQGIPVSVSNPNAPQRHAEVHRRDNDLISALLGIVTSILGSLNLPAATMQPAQAEIDRIQNMTAGSLLSAPALSIPRGAVEAVGVGSSYSSSSPVQSNSIASHPQVSTAASASATHQQADRYQGHGRPIHRRDTTLASAPSSSGSVHASSISASGSVRASSASASGKPALAVVPSPPVSLPIPNPSLPVSLPIPNPSLPVSVPVPIHSLPVSPPTSVPTPAASGVSPKASGTTKGKRIHHRQ